MIIIINTVDSKGYIGYYSKNIMEKLFVKKNSALHKIPLGLQKRQVLFLEGIRYNINMISSSYIQLCEVLKDISVEDENKDDSFYIVFRDVWSIIDSFPRLENMIKKSFTIVENEDNKDVAKIKFLEKVRVFRNTFQHLEERIDENILKNNTPLMGVLSWVYIVDTDNCISCTLMPGHPRDNYPYPIINPLNKKLHTEIEAITLESIGKNNNNPIRIDISEIMRDLKLLTESIEMQLENQFLELKNPPTYGQDIAVKLSLKSNNGYRLDN